MYPKSSRFHMAQSSISYQDYVQKTFLYLSRWACTEIIARRNLAQSKLTTVRTDNPLGCSHHAQNIGTLLQRQCTQSIALLMPK